MDTLSDAIATDGRVSLREAILAANANAAANEAAAGQGAGVTDTITFDASIAGGTITLIPSALNTTQLEISGDLAIYGPVTVRAAEAYGGIAHPRVFFVRAGAVVTMYGLTVTKGDADEGGGIYNEGALTLLSCVVSENSAKSGGGIFNRVGGSLVLRDCLVSGNAASDGGGVFSGGEVEIEASALSENHASVDGGGLYTVGAASLSESFVTGNFAGSSYAPSSSDGGGIYNAAGVVTAAGCTVSGNVAWRGGGIFNAANGRLVAADSTLFRNSSFAGESGAGGVCSGGAASFTGCEIVANSGGLSNLGSMTVASSSVAGNSGYGVSNGRTLRIEESRVSENSGTGIVNRNSAEVIGSVVYGNGSRRPDGGGLSNTDRAVLVLTGSLVAGNAARYGGGVYSLGALKVTDCRVALNGAALGQADARGGGIYTGGAAEISGSLITRNVSIGDGGGLYNRSGGTLAVRDSTLSVNAAVRGGGLSNEDGPGPVTFSRSAIAGNTADWGGAVESFVTGGTSLSFYDTTVSGNYARWFGGGLRGVGGFYNATVFGNRAGRAGGGGGIYGGAELVNTIVAGNVWGASGTAGTPSDVEGGSLGDHSLIGDAATAGGLMNGVNGNIVGVDWRTVLDPILRYNGGSTPTHALIAGSPAIDAGTASPLATDQRGAGYPRQIGAAVDIGAFEYGAGVAAAGRAAQRASADESLAAFWAGADRDEELARGLLAAS